MHHYFPFKFQSQKIIYSVLLVISLIPTYFIHSQKYPDWGDDFAQYIYQAQQINSPSEDYKQVLNIEEYSSPKRSLAFSLLLSIISPTCSIQDYVGLISACYILAGLCFFIFLSSHFSMAVSLIATLCVFYNFLFLRLKSEVVPEFLFIALFYGILYLAFSSAKWVKFFIPVLLGIMVSVRFVGLSLIISYIIFIFIQNDKTLKQKLKNAAICFLIFLLIIAGINYFFLDQINNQEVKLYGNLVFKNYSFNTFFENIILYSRYLLLFFEQEIPFWMNNIFKFSAVIFLSIGFFISIKNKVTIVHIALIVYFLFLFIYPYNGDTIKYLIPIFPLVLFFIIKGAYGLLDFIHFNRNDLLVFICLSIILLSNSKTIKLAMEHKDLNIGPYDLSVLEDFEEIKNRVGRHESIAFGKPFIVNLLADRHSYFLSKENHSMVFSKATYFLSPKEKIRELYPKIDGIKIAKGDTLELTNFYLVRLNQ
ncbi:MAG: hypothetical protein H7141_08800 [Burkholderiales bacterium]|nr:hypothetical protein [Bacteroidia bacterium]